RVPLIAFLVAQLPRRSKIPYYLCLTEDNRWTVVAHQDVVEIATVTIDRDSLAALEALEPPLDLAHKLGQYYPGNDSTAAVVEAMPLIPYQEATAPEVTAQGDRLNQVLQALETHPLNQWGQPGPLVKRHNLRSQLRQRLRDRQASYKEHQTHHWREFSNLVKVLREFAALDEYNPLPIGQAAAAIRGDNELWLGLVLMSGHLDDLDPQDLAAAAYVLISEPPRPDSWSHYAPPESVLLALAKLIPLRKELIKVQYRHKVTLPVWLEDETLEVIGLIEQWVLGVSWEALCENTSFDEGDLVRMLRRTADLLSQIPHVPGLPVGLCKNARRALDLMRRFPIDADL
ncbi:MAG: RNA helicase, partial [Spirulina sp. DLM2.Bin59]